MVATYTPSRLFELGEAQGCELHAAILLILSYLPVCLSHLLTCCWIAAHEGTGAGVEAWKAQVPRTVSDAVGSRLISEM